MLQQALENYRLFLDSLSAKGKSIICISAPLPTIPDGIIHGEVANARNAIKANQLERTQLTLLFNSKMQEFCMMKGYGYLMLDQYSLGNDGLIHPELVNPDKSDHHYRDDTYIELLTKHLYAYAEQNPSLKSYFKCEPY